MATLNTLIDSEPTQPTFLKERPWFLPLMIIIGVVILATAGYFLFRYLRKRKIQRLNADNNERIKQNDAAERERMAQAMSTQ